MNLIEGMSFFAYGVFNNHKENIRGVSVTY